MPSKALKTFENVSGNARHDVAEVLIRRREELRIAIIAMRDERELIRLQGRAEEIDAVIKALLSEL